MIPWALFSKGLSAQQSKPLRQAASNFGLKVGKDGELEYRGPTSSVIGDRLPTVHDGSEPSRPETLAALDFQPNDMELQCHVNLFVEWQNSSILVLPGSIIDQIVTSYPPPSSDVATRAVLWAILSLTYKVFASHIVDHADRRALSDQAFEEAARLTTNLAHRKPSVEVVQAACILACREYSCGHENSAWTFHGIACTVGSSIGLQAGRDYDKWVATGHLTPEKAEARVVAYWATILADRMFGCCLGRNCLLHPTDFGTPEIKLRALAISNTSGPKPMVEGSSSYVDNVLNTFRCATDLWKLCDNVYTQIYIWQHDLTTLSLDKSLLNATIREMSSAVLHGKAQIEAWYSGLPKLLDIDLHGPLPHLLTIHMAYHNFFILSHRPLLFLDQMADCTTPTGAQAAPNTLSAAAVCTKGASEIIRLCQLYRQHYTLQCASFMLTHFLVNATTICLWNMDKADSEAAESAEAAIKECDELLQEIAEVWEIGKNALALLHDLNVIRENKAAASLESVTVADNTLLGNEGLELSGSGAQMPFALDPWTNILGEHFDQWDISLMFPTLLQDQGFL